MNILSDIFQQDQVVAGAGTVAAIISHTNSGSIGTVTINGSWFIAKNNVVMSGTGLTSAGAIFADSDYSSQLSQTFMLYSNLTLTNSQLVSETTFQGQQLITTGASGLSINVSGSKLCVSNNGGGALAQLVRLRLR